jgi:hypothetical protein
LVTYLHNEILFPLKQNLVVGWKFVDEGGRKFHGDYYYHDSSSKLFHTHTENDKNKTRQQDVQLVHAHIRK